jgi:hypothetical protein
MKTRNDEIYEEGVRAGQKGNLNDDFVESISRLIPILPRSESDEIRSKGYDYGAKHRNENKKIDTNEDTDGNDYENDYEDSGEFNIGEIIPTIIVFLLLYYFFHG